VLVQLKLPSTSSTDITSPTIAFFIASSRPAVIFDEVQGSFGASQLSNFALSASRCAASSLSDQLPHVPYATDLNRQVRHLIR